MGDPIDDAFDWLLLIMSTINGILIGLPETIEAKKGVAGALMPPFFVLIVVWLLGHLIKRKHLKAVLKTYAWFYAFFILLFLGEIFVDQTYGLIKFLHAHVFMVFPPSVILLLAFWFVGPFVFFERLVLPAYKEIYKDSRLLSTRRRLVSLYILALTTFTILTLPFLKTFASYLI